MAKKVIILTICLLLNACYFKNHKSLSLDNSIKQDSNICLDTTYLRLPLLYPLLNYIKNYDTVIYSWKISPLCLIRFYLEGNDTLVYISGHKIKPDVLLTSDDIGIEFKGGFFINDIPVLVFDSSTNLGSSFYIKSNLSDIVELADKGRDWHTYETKTLPTWICKISGKRDIKLIKIVEGVILK